jgi:hypothetical protein
MTLVTLARDRRQTVDVGMGEQVLAPSVKNAEDANRFPCDFSDTSPSPPACFHGEGVAQVPLFGPAVLVGAW